MLAGIQEVDNAAHRHLLTSMVYDTGHICLVYSCISRTYHSAWLIVGAQEIFGELAIINCRVY